ncbi:DUF86 domain-containing protein [Candidatus Woesearchaeota archaeon]|nr:DUF86 domain-containing protein [Candidatus Woesearchaeota archaeon]
MDEKKRILMKLEEMNKYLIELENILPTEDEYIHSLTERRASEKTIELAIEAVIAIISIIVAKERLGFPEDEDSLINLLEQKKIFSSKLCQTLRGMKGFRNVLVHKYGEIDDELAYEFLSNQLSDFEAFEKEVRKYLQKQR